MFGPSPNVERMIGTMSVQELVQLAQNPTAGDANVQYAAISEIERRKKMQAPPQQSVNQPTVIQKMAMEAMEPRQQAPVPGDPIAQGVASMMMQQQSGRPPQRMADGGQVSGTSRRIVEDMSGIMEMLGPNYNTTARTPEEIMALQRQFYGDGDYMESLIPGIKDDEERARSDRRSNMWLALARAGFGMASTGSIGEGAMLGLNDAQEALGTYNEAMSDARGRRERIGLARGQRGDQLASSGLDMLLDSERSAAGASQDLLSTSSGIASAGAQIESANARSAADQSQVERLADILYEENRGRVEWEQYDAPGAEGGIGMRQREYSRSDAMRDALVMVGGRGGSGPDDLNEQLRSALFLADPMNQADAETQARARQVVDEIMSGERGNVGSTTEGGGGVAPAERSSMRRPDNAQVEEYARTRRATQVGEHNGQRVITPY